MELPPLPSSVLPTGIRSRILHGINGLDIHVLEAGFGMRLVHELAGAEQLAQRAHDGKRVPGVELERGPRELLAQIALRGGREAERADREVRRLGLVPLQIAELGGHDALAGLHRRRFHRGGA